MPNVPVLGLVGGFVGENELAFDGQPMQRGVNLRWSFTPELGFPPGGFWLYRRLATKGEKLIPPPPFVTSTNLALVAGGSEWEATMSQPCQTVTLAGCATANCSEVVIETFQKNSVGVLEVSGRRVVPVDQGAFRIKISAGEISGLRVAGATSVDHIECDPMPPSDCTGSGGGRGGRGGCGDPPEEVEPSWGEPGANGWQMWGAPFVLPVTDENWPARYFGAPNPLTTAPRTVFRFDIEEAKLRLGSLSLSAGSSPAKQLLDLELLWIELVRLVRGFPTKLLAEVPLTDGPSNPSTPDLNLSLIQELMLLAIDPYFARVLGLYFVDREAQAGVQYDYCIAGFWGVTPCMDIDLFPGLAPAAPLARGSAVFKGMTIKSGANSSLWRWVLNQQTGTYTPDMSAPPIVRTFANEAIIGLLPADLPEALLAVYSAGKPYPAQTSPPSISISFVNPMPQIDVQVSGRGSVTAFSGGVAGQSATFASAELQTVSLFASDLADPINQIQVVGTTQVEKGGIVLVVGQVTLHPIFPDTVCTQYALLHAPTKISPVAPPDPVVSTFRHRQAVIDEKTLTLVPESMIEVTWPAVAVAVGGDPVTDPIDLPQPSCPVGFVLRREDTGSAGSLVRIPGWVAAASIPAPASSPWERFYRYIDNNLSDPVGLYQYQIAGFDVFGAPGDWSDWSNQMGVEKIAAAPTNLRIIQFDNSATGGGAALPDGSAWVGGTLSVSANWSASAYMMYPDISTAQIKVEAVELVAGAGPGDPATTEVIGTLSTLDVSVPPATVQQITISSIVPTLQSDGITYVVDIVSPDFTALSPQDPAAVLMLTQADGPNVQYVVRPAIAPKNDPNHPAVIVQLSAGASAPVVANATAYAAQRAYLVTGCNIQDSLAVPLDIPLGQNIGRGQVSVTGSTEDPFNPTEEIIDPNGVNPNKPEPKSVILAFTGPQRLVPAAPPNPPPTGTPAHIVDHLYYDPADITGKASKTLPFDTSQGAPEVSGYTLLRLPTRSLELSDVKRRNKSTTGWLDPNPAVTDPTGPRLDLQNWIQALPAWLTAYNAIQKANAAAQVPPLPDPTPLTGANVLQDAGALRSFVDHFYGGMLDDELCALANLPPVSASTDPGNLIAFKQVNSPPMAPGSTVSDSVDGTGFGRSIYNLTAVNTSASISPPTDSIGPYYTQIVTPPRPPVLYKVQPTQSSIIVAWALDTNPDVAAYFVYRGSSMQGPTSLNDLRYFGPNSSSPSPIADLAVTVFNQAAYPALSIGAGDLDPRIVGFVADPRLCARDYQGSNMGEISLPLFAEGGPGAIVGVFRLSEYTPALAANPQGLFNYWTPEAAGGVAQFIPQVAPTADNPNPAPARLTGLRIGLGRGVPVVVVVKYQGQSITLGQVPIRRAAFTDGITSTGAAFDPNAVKGYTGPSTAGLNTYAVVAVDIFGNFSAPSSIFAAQMLAPTPA